MSHHKMILVQTSYIAETAGISPQAVNKRAKARGIKPAMQAGNAKLWHPDDVPKLLLDIGKGWKARTMRETFVKHRKAS